MFFLENIDTVWLALIIRILAIVLKYFIFAGAAFFIFYVWKKRDWWVLKIQQKMPKAGSIRHEIFWSVLSRVILGVVAFFIIQYAGLTQLYYDMSTYGWAYFAFSVVFLILLHDTYFYWAHRMMHHPRLYKYMHKVHHHSINPTPWASFSFHPSEALVEIALFPIVIMLMPVHIGALLIVILFQMTFNVYGHAGFELFPKWWVKHPVLKYLNTSSHHNYHHKEFNYNFGLYFNHWDRICGTLDPDYDAKFLALKERSTPYNHITVKSETL